MFARSCCFTLPTTRAVSVAAELCRYLMARGVEDFHIYTLNRADLAAALCRLLRNDMRSRKIVIEEPRLLAGGLL